MYISSFVPRSFVRSYLRSLRTNEGTSSVKICLHVPRASLLDSERDRYLFIRRYEGTYEGTKVKVSHPSPWRGEVERRFPSTVSSLTTPSGRSTVIRVDVVWNMTYMDGHRIHPGL